MKNILTSYQKNKLNEFAQTNSIFFSMLMDFRRKNYLGESEYNLLKREIKQ